MSTGPGDAPVPVAPAPAPATTTPLQGLVVVVLVDYEPRHKAWGWLRLAQGPGQLQAVPGLRFCKIMGSGHGGGFSIRPSSTHQGLLALLDDDASAQAFLASPFLQAMRERSRMFWAGLMTVDSARGSWDGQAWAPTPTERLGAHATALDSCQRHRLAVITRASIRPSQAMSFWRHAPASQLALDSAPGCLLAMGLGEAPVLRQCTFSLWRSTASMESYAHGAAHGSAAQAAWRREFFSESMFVRLRVLHSLGQWQRPGQVQGPAA